MINMSLALEAFPQMLPDPLAHWHKIPQSQVETPTTVQWESLASQGPESRGGIPPSTTQNKLWGVRHLPSERARTSYRTLKNLPLISHRSKWGGTFPHRVPLRESLNRASETQIYLGPLEWPPVCRALPYPGPQELVKGIFLAPGGSASFSVVCSVFALLPHWLWVL